jgi:pimeloyl-ACP methyl ester carboxylesterase
VWVDGTGPALVMVHGSIADHTTFEPFVAVLRDHFTTFAMDRRGFGASGDTGDYDIERDFDDVAADVDAVAARTSGTVALWGHPYGANCATGAATLTGNIHHLVLYEPSLGLPYPPGSIENIEAALARGDHDAAIATVLVDILEMNDDEIDAFRAARCGRSASPPPRPSPGTVGPSKAGSTSPASSTASPPRPSCSPAPTASPPSPKPPPAPPPRSPTPGSTRSTDTATSPTRPTPPWSPPHPAVHRRMKSLVRVAHQVADLYTTGNPGGHDHGRCPRPRLEIRFNVWWEFADLRLRGEWPLSPTATASRPPVDHQPHARLHKESQCPGLLADVGDVGPYPVLGIPICGRQSARLSRAYRSGPGR